MRRHFYDIESLEQAFTVSIWRPDDNAQNGDVRADGRLDIYVLFDDPEMQLDGKFLKGLLKRIQDRNPALAKDHPLWASDTTQVDEICGINLFNLHDPGDAESLVREFGLDTDFPLYQKAFAGGLFENGKPKYVVDEPETENEKTDDRKVKTTNPKDAKKKVQKPVSVRVFDYPWPDPSFKYDFEAKDDPTCYYLMGYNSYNYDMTMMARYFAKLLDLEGRLDEIKKWKKPDSTRAAIDTARVTAKDMRAFNDILFTEHFIRNMPSALCFPDPVARKGTPTLQEAVEKGPENCKRTFDLAANLVRSWWLRTGRFVDVARLNEKQQRVGLKRQLAVLGRQILESSKLDSASRLENRDDYLELLAYNVSDVVNLQYLEEDRNYAATLENKQMIIDEYPETLFDPSKRVHDVLTAPSPTDDPYMIPEKARTRENVRRDRLRVDSSSQQIIAMTLCPERNSPLLDTGSVTLYYPDRKSGDDIEPRDVLDETVAYFRDNVLARITDPELKREAEREFDLVRRHYDWIRHRNFNGGTVYTNGSSIPVSSIEDGPVGDEQEYDDDDMTVADDGYGGDDGNAVVDEPFAANADSLPGIGTCLRYYTGDGRASSCYAIMSEGGIHGAEYDLALYDADLADYRMARDLLEQAKKISNDDPVVLRSLVKRSLDPIVEDADGNAIAWCDGRDHIVADFLKSGFTRTRGTWKEVKAPELFKYKTLDRKRELQLASALGDGLKDVRPQELNKRYVYTTVGQVNHDDFASYYPGLLRKMRAFFNEAIGRDRYGDIYNQKQEFGVYMKDPDRSPEERAFWKVRRNGVKLLLNAASGAADAAFDNTIRMNNRATAMRLIGQMFTWRIGQAQTLEGARVPSTNTDGLFTIMDEADSDRVLARESANIGVDIEPERTWIVTKDANNRVEFDVADPASGSDADVLVNRFRINAAGGASVSCYDGPSTAKSLDHPAIYDWLTAYYLMNLAVRSQEAMTEPFDAGLARRVLDVFMAERDAFDVLRMFQNVLASSSKSRSYVVAAPVADGGVREYRNLLHYNRVFYTRPDADAALAAAGFEVVTMARVCARKVSDVLLEKRGAKGLDFGDQTLLRLLKEKLGPNDLIRGLKAEQREPALVKVADLDLDQHCVIVNDDLRCLADERRAALVSALDLDAYVAVVGDKFESNWRNGARPANPYQTILRRDRVLDAPKGA